jgi:glucose-6-phosphate isomerase
LYATHSGGFFIGKEMRDKLAINLSRMLDENIHQTGKSSLHDLKELDSKLKAIQIKLRNMVDSAEGTFANTFSSQEIENVLSLAKKHKGKWDDFLLIGIGGSTWGTIAIQAALCHGMWNDNPKLREGFPRFQFLDNSDPEALANVIDGLDPKRTLVNVVSKSGTTAETAANFMSVAGHFKQSIGDTWAKHFVLTTDSGKGLLQRIAQENNIDVLNIPPATGGRFSLLSAVGMFPSALLGLDIKEILRGAEVITRDTLDQTINDNRVMIASALCWKYFDSSEITVNVLMPYARSLRYVANWYVQLWGESLGKKFNNSKELCHSGSTPLGALGAADQHSLLQLFMEGPADKLITFLRVEKFRRDPIISSTFTEHPEIAYLSGHNMSELINVEQEATAEALLKEGRGSRTITIPEVNEYWLGQLFQFLMLETFINGELMGVNTFDQPGVEAGKLLTYAGMGRDGFRKQPEALQSELVFE